MPASKDPARAPDGGAIVGEDGKARTPWAYTNDLMRGYYDTEWGMPVRDEHGVFERLSLEAFQAGLSWHTILGKRDAFRVAFDGFNPDVVSAYTASDIEGLLNNAGIVRHRGKIEAVVANAKATVALRGRVTPPSAGPTSVTATPMKGGGGLAELVWSYRPASTPEPQVMADVATQSPESAALARTLKREGFRFVGPTSMYALMEALGIVDTHLVGSFRRGCSGVWPL